ncbi:Retrovirus-related Pol polyprotein from transposon TNT 1-94-like protein [Drosera capensis]
MNFVPVIEESEVVAESVSPVAGTIEPKSPTCVGDSPPTTEKTSPSTPTLRIPLQVLDSPDTSSGPVCLRDITNIYVNTEEVTLDDGENELIMLEYNEPTRYREAAAETNLHWEVHHIDVKSAFLNGELEEEVYVTQSKRFEVQGKRHLVYRLSKALYGLRHASQAWNTRLEKSMKELAFRRCSQEQAVYTRGEGDATLIVGEYMLMTSL